MFPNPSWSSPTPNVIYFIQVRLSVPFVRISSSKSVNISDQLIADVKLTPNFIHEVWVWRHRSFVSGTRATAGVVRNEHCYWFRHFTNTFALSRPNLYEIHNIDPHPTSIKSYFFSQGTPTEFLSSFSCPFLLPFSFTRKPNARDSKHPTYQFPN